MELTESAVMSGAESRVEWLQAIKELGVGLAIDDFGTGYSSLSYLKKFPIDFLKIDRSFVNDLETDEHDVAIVSTIYSMAKALGLTVIVEGVETREQHELLRPMGDGLMQGFLVSKALPSKGFELFCSSYVPDKLRLRASA